MIFVGDIASPTPKNSEELYTVFQKYNGIFGEQALIGNLEGLICDNFNNKSKKPVLYNHSSVIDALRKANAKALMLANNHTLDLPNCFTETKEALEKEKIAFAGAGFSKDEANKPAMVQNSNFEVIFFNACFDFLLYNRKNPANGIYTAEIKEKNLINNVKYHKINHPQAQIVVYLHWSIDQETLPFPMYRQFARKLIDEGADLILGTHAHCVQGGEKYNNKYIIYGLGNFFIPNNIYAGGNLSFPEFSKTELAFEWDKEKNKATCHWFKYNDNNGHDLEHLKSEPFEDSAFLKYYTPYEGMSAKEYISFFKKNRRKKFLIPLYKDYRKTTKNRINTELLKGRAHFARLLAKTGIVKWQK